MLVTRTTAHRYLALQVLEVSVGVSGAALLLILMHGGRWCRVQAIVGLSISHFDRISTDAIYDVIVHSRVIIATSRRVFGVIQALHRCFRLKTLIIFFTRPLEHSGELGACPVICMSTLPHKLLSLGP